MSESVGQVSESVELSNQCLVMSNCVIGCGTDSNQGVSESVEPVSESVERVVCNVEVCHIVWNCVSE